MQTTRKLSLAVVLLVLGACERQPVGPSGAGNANASGTAPADAGAHGTLADVQQQTAQAVSAAVAYARQQRDAYWQQVQPELAKLDKRLTAARARVVEMAEEARPAWERRLNEAAARFEAAQERVAALRSKGGDVWEEAQRQLEMAAEELRAALAEATSQPASRPSSRPAAD